MANDSTVESWQCEGTTQSGRQCRNPASRNSRFCSLHRPPANRCPAMTLKQRQCRLSALEGREFCQVHIVAREQGWNWWEWSNQEEAEATRQRLVDELESRRFAREDDDDVQWERDAEGNLSAIRDGIRTDYSTSFEIRVPVSAQTADSQSGIDEESEPVAKRTPWWRRWWMIIIWVVLFVMACSAVVGALPDATTG